MNHFCCSNLQVFAKGFLPMEKAQEISPWGGGNALFGGTNTLK